MTTAITVENLSKRFILSHQRKERYTAMRDVIATGAKRIASKLTHPFAKPEIDPAHEEFWALRDISFDIEQGDRIGIIGRNGAGKSTLLKILSRITEPTSGRVSIHGRVASLLEVGTGFHPELTGRENIFLNGAILGMSKAEITRKFDEIVAFAEVEKFLDTPVKRYSSGMYVRLAFAVAAHLEPEILIVDEVLAVGDAQFQKKCMGKMKEVGDEGRTIIFVSHNMSAVEQLCSSAISLTNGQVEAHDRDVRKVISTYLQEGISHNHKGEWVGVEHIVGNPWFNPKRFAVLDSAGNVMTSPVRNDTDICIYIEAEIDELDPALTFGFALYNEDGVHIYRTYQTDGAENSWPVLKKGNNKLICKLPKHTLNEGSYSLELIASQYQRKWLYRPGSGMARVEFSIQGGLSDSPYWHKKRPGILAPILSWQVVEI